jgi:ubiquinol-cytochrome c reductase cytochrome b subunit
MKALLAWIDDRTGLFSAVGDWLRGPVAGGPDWRNVWPATIAFAMLTQIVTGIVILMYYSPGAQTAWESVYYLQTQVLGGWLLRAVHHYAGQVMLVLIGVYLVQTIVRGLYRAPREFLFWVVVLAGLLTLAFNLTGDLLAWDQNGFWSTRVRTGFLLLLPGVGNDLFKLAIGGPAFGHLTATRFLALHAGVLPALMLGVLALHAWLGNRSAKGEKGLTTTAAGTAGSYWPDQAWRDALACVAVMAVILGLSLQHGVYGPQAGVELGAPANPAEAYAAARPEWSFRGLYEFAHLFPARLEFLPIFVIPGALLLLVLLMPFMAKLRGGHRFNIIFIVLVLVGIAALSWQSYARDAKDTEHQNALLAGEEQAQRIRELARSPQGIPVSGALTLLRHDAKTQGPRLFQQYCASCHSYLATVKRTGEPAPNTAPNLYGFASRRWLTGLLDPKQIAGPEYFGNTKLRNKDMPSFVKNTLSKLDAGEKKDLEKVVMAVSAEAGLKSQSKLDAADAAQIKEGQTLLGTFGCTDCHKFHEEGKLGDAPELNGYGSRRWLVGIISNPAHKRFYGKKNDRMPAYAPSDDPAQNQLSQQDIGLLAEWLRGQWYVEYEN